MIQSLKFELNPSLIIAPANSDVNWLERLGASAETSAVSEAATEEGEVQAEVFTVLRCKSKDFSGDSRF